MPTDAYIKFGEGTNPSPNDSKVMLPLIEGDSTDETHYWWCELRGYDFSLDAGERDASSHGDDREKPKPSFKKVTIKKRVDWASTELFMKCCNAAQATTRKSKAQKDNDAVIDQVTIDICKQSTEKFPFLTVKYYGVRVVGYGIDVNGPEPSETISFVFEELDFEYQPTDPYDGSKKEGAASKAMGMKNYKQAPAVAATGGIATTTSAATAAAGAASGAAGNSSAAGSPASNGADSAAPSSTEAVANTNFPGLWTGTGFGILPD
jgi:type VI protein secretion system component Hcp